MPAFVILARGGSVGLPGKNKKLLLGMPLIAIAIDKCFQAFPDSRVIVSTDDAGIADIALEHNAEVVDRPPHLATSEATSVDGILHAVDVAGMDGTICHVQCTNPFMTPADIVGTVRVSNFHDMAVCVTETHDLLVDAEGFPINWDRGQSSKTLRQNRPKQYKLAGSVWAYGDTDKLKRQYAGDIGIHVAESPVQVDIDTPTDFAIAEALYGVLA